MYFNLKITIYKAQKSSREESVVEDRNTKTEVCNKKIGRGTLPGSPPEGSPPSPTSSSPSP
jgi:hypothetical protein